MLWIDTTVGDFCPLVYGKAIKRQDQLQGGFPVYGSNGMYAYSAKKLVSPHAVIVGRKGSVGKVHLSQSPCWVSDTAFYVQYGSLEDAYFTYYLLSTLRLESMNTDAAVPGLNRNNAHRLNIRIPEKNEDRKRLVTPLIVLDKKIKLNHQINQTLEKMAQAIFKSWFVDFEPVKAKIAALDAGGSEEDALLAAMLAVSGKTREDLTRLQAEQPEQYAELRATAELFPSAMQDSELGEIPEGWCVSQIGDEVTVAGGGTPSTKNSDFWENGEINWTSPKDLSNLADKVLVETERKITEAGLAKVSSGLLPVDTVLMSSRAPVGYLALAKIPVAVNQGYIAMKCEKALSPEFVIQWCAAYMDEIKSRASGTTFAEISKKNFRIIPVVTPPEALISVYSKQTSSLYEVIENNVRESDILAKLRDSLLPKLLSGELSVSAAETQLAEAEEPANV
ncbi:restriction endonuclease subunit S [Halomonas piscis]|uniref:Restriction endonuclease subunit S n=1 Tax=Halomonas piscis TaxID=3031727 RepID=A0ABY9Z1Q3_9GAMM|nr:restriction endonuclease subunit S [Halomonas piscis]WNK20209.1 restriction endonuclease subunit S [Halomonas piscis]